MPENEFYVKGRDKLTGIFGAWPSFHDAEIVDFHYWRGKVKPGKWDDRNIFPALTLKIRILEATPPGAGHAGNDTLATIRFTDIDGFTLKRFDHMNSILGLSIAEKDRGNDLTGAPLTPGLIVNLESFASFWCFGIEVMDAVPFKDEWQ